MEGRNDERNKGRKKERGATSERKELEEDKEV